MEVINTLGWKIIPFLEVKEKWGKSVLNYGLMFKEKEKKTALIGIIVDGVLFQGFVRR